MTVCLGGVSAHLSRRYFSLMPHASQGQQKSKSPLNTHPLLRPSPSSYLEGRPASSLLGWRNPGAEFLVPVSRIYVEEPKSEAGVWPGYGCPGPGRCPGPQAPSRSSGSAYMPRSTRACEGPSAAQQERRPQEPRAPGPGHVFMQPSASSLVRCPQKSPWASGASAGCAWMSPGKTTRPIELPLE